MKKSFLAFATAILLGIAGCGEDKLDLNTPTNFIDPSIEVSSVEELPGEFAVGEEIKLTVLLTTDPNIGIVDFWISKNGRELVSETTFETTQVAYEYTYVTSFEDTQSFSTPFTFSLTDALGKTTSTTTSINVSVEYSYINDRLIPVPGFDLVNNIQVNPEADPTSVDMVRETLPEGDNRYFSLSTTEYYPVSGSLDFFDANITTAQIEEAISGSTAITSFFDADGSAFPIVAKLRGVNEYALIGPFDSNSNLVRLVYRKRSADAGL